MMVAEAMCIKNWRLIVCLIVTAVSHSHAHLQFNIEQTGDPIYCGLLQCSVNYNEYDTDVLSIIRLAIYEGIQGNIEDKLATMSIFSQYVFVETTKDNFLKANGSVSRYHGDLVLSLRDETACLYGDFTCEVEFVNVTGQPVVIREFVTQESNGSCPMLGSQIAKLAAQIQIRADGVDADLAEIKAQNTAMAASLQMIADQFSRLEISLNVNYYAHQITCTRGMLPTSSRQKFLLWGTVPALCDTETDGGGWVIIQRRTNGDVNFNKDWPSYKFGFGTQDTDFWIGNSIIHNLTSQGYNELRIDMADQSGQFHAQYTSFSVADEGSYYALSVGGYTGTDFDPMVYTNGRYFSTLDRDYDGNGFPTAYRGGWWYYGSYYYSNLNGLWGVNGDSGIDWYSNNIGYRHLTWTEMKVRRA